MYHNICVSIWSSVLQLRIGGVTKNWPSAEIYIKAFKDIEDIRLLYSLSDKHAVYGLSTACEIIFSVIATISVTFKSLSFYVTLQL